MASQIGNEVRRLEKKWSAGGGWPKRLEWLEPDQILAKAKAAPEMAGDVWTWTAIDADSKLIVSPI